MSRKAIAIHVVEKGKKAVNLQRVDESKNIWESGNWRVGDDTAESLKGGMIYVHKSQNSPSHIGGKIISFSQSESKGKNRKIFTFKALENETGFLADREGWGNEKKIVWEGRVEKELKILKEDDASTFPEGGERYAVHKAHERDTAFSKRVKLDRIQKVGKLECDVCGFDFSVAFGSHGAGYIEAHHTIPVSQLSGKVKTKASDLALVCSNCHRMLHRGIDLLTIAELKAILSGEV